MAKRVKDRNKSYKRRNYNDNTKIIKEMQIKSVRYHCLLVNYQRSKTEERDYSFSVNHILPFLLTNKNLDVCGGRNIPR
jgi:hypothetical protein